MAQRENNLLVPSRFDQRRGRRDHDETVIPDTVKTMWDTGMTTTWAEEGQVAVLAFDQQCRPNRLISATSCSNGMLHLPTCSWRSSILVPRCKLESARRLYLEDLAHSLGGIREEQVIFVHSSFRTGSTYLWSQLRKAASTLAYYEIFNENLASMRPEEVRTLRPETWDSRHPLGAPYFEEFLPLLEPGGGIKGFEPSLSYERFIPPQGCHGQISRTEAEYIERLIRHAEDRGRIPVLTDTRTLGRLRGLKRAAPGLHLLLYRNLYQQWCSICQQARGGNPYFLERLKEILCFNQHDPIVATLQNHFPLDALSTSRPETFSVFALLHLHLYVQAAGGADLIVDLNKLERDEKHRENVELTIEQQAIKISLAGTRNSTSYSLCPLGSSQDLLDRLRVVAGMILDQAPDAFGRTFGETVMSELIEEYDRSEFYTTDLRKSLSCSDEKALSSARELSALQGKLELVYVECDSLRRQSDNARLANEEIERLRENCHVDRTHAQQQLAIVRAAFATLNAERDAAIQERKMAEDATRVAIEGLERLRHERDGHLERLIVEANARAAICAQLEKLRDENEQTQVTAQQLSCQLEVQVARVRALSRALVAKDEQQATWLGELQGRIAQLKSEIEELCVNWITDIARPSSCRPRSLPAFRRYWNMKHKAIRFRRDGDAARNILDWAKAARAYQHYLEIEPTDHMIWVQYGHALKQAGALMGALAAYNKSAKLQPIDNDRDVHLLDLQQRLTIDAPNHRP